MPDRGRERQLPPPGVSIPRCAWQLLPVLGSNFCTAQCNNCWLGLRACLRHETAKVVMYTRVRVACRASQLRVFCCTLSDTSLIHGSCHTIMATVFAQSMTSFVQSRNEQPPVGDKDSLSRTQDPAIGSYPEPFKSVRIFRSYFFTSHVNIMLTSTSRSPVWSLLFRFSEWRSLQAHISRPCYDWHMPCPSHVSWLHHHSHIWRKTEITKLLTKPFSQIPCCFSYRRLRYSPQRPLV
jgi:hypothetical protein